MTEGKLVFNGAAKSGKAWIDEFKTDELVICPGPPDCPICAGIGATGQGYVPPPGILGDLEWLIPGMRELVACPDPVCDHDPVRVSSMIMHLNDSRGWTREAIADWLETLDVDLTFPTEPPPPRPQRPRRQFSAKPLWIDTEFAWEPSLTIKSSAFKAFKKLYSGASVTISAQVAWTDEVIKLIWGGSISDSWSVQFGIDPAKPQDLKTAKDFALNAEKSAPAALKRPDGTVMNLVANYDDGSSPVDLGPVRVHDSFLTDKKYPTSNAYMKGKRRGK